MTLATPSYCAVDEASTKVRELVAIDWEDDCAKVRARAAGAFGKGVTKEAKAGIRGLVT